MSYLKSNHAAFLVVEDQKDLDLISDALPNEVLLATSTQNKNGDQRNDVTRGRKDLNMRR